ncbi:MAG: hypothetical protein C5B50_16200 [Verrucomicrobia bacterium]|nr:MAG: hypothetical protein C5B50_16200 [Verrucomicrobiota bacterium]
MKKSSCPSKNPTQFITNSIISVAALFLLSCGAVADETWLGTTDNQWTTPGNWSTTLPTASDMVVYNSSSTANLSNYLAQGFSIKGLAISNNATFSVNGSVLTNGAGGIDMSQDSAGTVTLNSPLVVNGNQNWTMATAGGFLTIVGSVSGAGNIAVSAPVNTLSLKSSNSFSGTFTLNSGSVYAYSPGAFSTNLTTVANGTRILFTTGSGSVNGTIPGSFVINGAGPALDAGTAGTLFSGSISLGSASTIRSLANGNYTLTGPVLGNNFNLTCTTTGNSTNTISGPITLGSGALLPGGSVIGSTLRLTSSGNSWSGGTTITIGTLQIGDGANNGFLPGNVAVNSGLLNFLVAPSTSQTYSGVISGAGGVYKDGLGALYLTATNTFSGSITNNGGPLWFNGSTNWGTGVKIIACINNLVGAGIHLNGTNGNLIFPSTITWWASQNQGAIFNEAGSNVIAGPINVGQGGGDAYLVVNAGTLVLNGAVALGGATPARNLILGGTGNGLALGAISSGGLSLVKADSGTWTLAAANSYGVSGVGTTTVSNGTLVVNSQILASGSTNTLTVQGGTLAGYGIIKSPTIITTGGTLALGSGIGTMTIQNSLSLAGSNIMKIAKNSGVTTNDLISGLTHITYGGTLVVQSSGSGFAGGDTFRLFSAGSYSGSFGSIILPALGGSLTWDTSTLGSNGQIKITSSAPLFSTPPVRLSDGNVQVSFSGSSGAAYRLWASTNVVVRPITSTWTLLSSGTFGGSPISYSDLSATNFRSRYYVVSTP